MKFWYSNVYRNADGSEARGGTFADPEGPAMALNHQSKAAGWLRVQIWVGVAWPVAEEMFRPPVHRSDFIDE